MDQSLSQEVLQYVCFFPRGLGPYPSDDDILVFNIFIYYLILCIVFVSMILHRHHAYKCLHLQFPPTKTSNSALFPGDLFQLICLCPSFPRPHIKRSFFLPHHTSYLSSSLISYKLLMGERKIWDLSHWMGEFHLPCVYIVGEEEEGEGGEGEGDLDLNLYYLFR